MKYSLHGIEPIVIMEKLMLVFLIERQFVIMLTII